MAAGGGDYGIANVRMTDTVLPSGVHVRDAKTPDLELYLDGKDQSFAYRLATQIPGTIQNKTYCEAKRELGTRNGGRAS